MIAIDVDALTRNVQRVAAKTGIIESDGAARLHGVRDDAVIVDAEPHNVGSSGERQFGRGHIACLPVETQVAWNLGGNLDRAVRARRCRGDHGGDRRVIDGDALGGIERLFVRLGDDQRHRLADVPHLLLRQQRLRHECAALSGLDVGLDGGQQRPQAVLASVGGGEDRQNSRSSTGSTGIDRQDARMRVRRSQHDGVC